MCGGEGESGNKRMLDARNRGRNRRWRAVGAPNERGSVLWNVSAQRGFFRPVCINLLLRISSPGAVRSRSAESSFHIVSFPGNWDATNPHANHRENIFTPNVLNLVWFLICILLEQLSMERVREQMKRGQLVERNSDLLKFVVQQPIASLDLGEKEQSSVSRNSVVTPRNLRFRTTFSRESCTEAALEDLCIRLNETYSTVQKACPIDLHVDCSERELNGRVTLEDLNDALEKNGGAVGARDCVLEISQIRVCSSVLAAKGLSKMELEIDEDLPQIVMNTHSRVDESEQGFSSPVARNVTSSSIMKEPQSVLGKGDPGKENWDPNVEWSDKKSGSPLPEWFSRKPLQDITDVLAAEQGKEQQPQPKKKLKRKVSSSVTSLFPTLSESLTTRKDSSVIQLKCATFAAPKQYSYLGKNFR
uniref:Uncharacterized protein n=2 Tax=Physcomitrium patens TaxID=3218 RepID=A0A7I4E707_PHYPA